MFDTCFNSWQAEGYGWSIGYQWRSMDWLIRAEGNTLFIFCDRSHRYWMAHRQTRAFLRDGATALRDGRFDEVLTITGRNSKSHVATAISATLTAFASTTSQFTDAEAVDTAKRAFQRSRQMLFVDLNRGLSSLSTIATSAPFIGFLGTVFGILNAFRAVGMAKAAFMARIASDLAQALVTTAMGILIAVAASWSHKYLRGRMQALEHGMSDAALQVVTSLNTHRRWRNQHRQPAVGATGLALSSPHSTVGPGWDAPYDRQRALLLGIWLYLLYIAFVVFAPL